MYILRSASRPRKEQLAPHVLQVELERQSVEIRRLRRQLRSALRSIQYALADTASSGRVRAKPVQDKVLALLKDEGEMSTAHIADALRRSHKSTGELLSRMRASNLLVSRRVGVRTAEGGWYIKWNVK